MKKLLIFSLFTFGISIANAQSYNISTVAGNGIGGYTGDGGQATNGELYQPFGVAVDKAGNIYIADDNNKVVRKVNTSGIITTFAGTGVSGYSGDGGQATAAELNGPTGVIPDGAGNVYIADESNSRIRLVNSAGIITTYAGTGVSGYSGDGGQATAAELNYPSGGMALDAAGSLYIADQSNCRIRKVTSGGVITSVAGNGSPGFSGDGGQATAAEIQYPFGVAMDKTGNMYIADVNNHRVRRVDAGGAISTFAGTGTPSFSGDGGQATAADLQNPNGVSVDASGTVYIADSFNNRVRMVNAGNIITTIAGNGVGGFSGDGGLATAAQLNLPFAVAIDTVSGNMFVADMSNNRIRELMGPPLGLGQSMVTSNELSVYPNPGNGFFNLTISNYELGIKGTVEVYNMLGEKVYSAKLSIQHSKFNIDISDQPNGIYLYKVISETGNLLGTGRFIKE